MIDKYIDKNNAIFTFSRIDRIDITNANRIKIKVLRSIVNPKIENIIIDLSGLDFMDTYGAQILVTLRKFARRKQKSFFLQSVSKEFKEIIDLLKLESDFRII